MHRPAIQSAAVLVLALIAACDPPQPASTETDPIPATAPGIQVSEVRVTIDDAAEPGGGEDVDRLLAAETVYVLVWVTGDGNGDAAEIATAVRRRQDDTVVEERMQSVEAARHRKVVFELTQPGGWQPGEYVAAVTVGEQDAAERRFEIEGLVDQPEDGESSADGPAKESAGAAGGAPPNRSTSR